MKKETIALLVIDVQRVYTDPQSDLFCDDNDRTINNINEMIDLFKLSGNPIIFVRHIHALDGSDLGHMFDYTGDFDDFNFKAGSPEVEYALTLKRPEGAIEIVKNRYSAFQRTELESILINHKIDRVVVCGFMTNFCCESTAREAHDKDFLVTFITDATGCPNLPQMPQKNIREIVSVFLEAGFATIMNTVDFIKKEKGIQ